MTIHITPGIEAAQFAAGPNGRSRPVPTQDAASQGGVDRVTLSTEALALKSSNTAADVNTAPDAAAWHFPPADAPAKVHAAWAEATRDMSAMDRLAAEGAFMAEEVSANLKYDAAGRAVGVHQRGEPGYTELWSQPGLSYSDRVDHMREGLEKNRAAYNELDYVFYSTMLADFQSALADGA